jgi:hypothetical protein
MHFANRIATSPASLASGTNAALTRKTGFVLGHGATALPPQAI